MIMKRLLTFILICCALAGAKAQSRWHELKVGPFSSLTVVNDMDVTCRCVPDSAGYVRFYCPEENADAVMVEGGASKLKVMISPDFIERTERVPEVMVYTDSLNYAESSSTGRVRIERLPRVGNLKVVLMDNGSIELPGINIGKLHAAIATGRGTIAVSGRADKALYRLVGTGCIDARDVAADEVTCRVLGGGDIYCQPVKQLVLKGLGTTRVHYKGTPGKIKKSGLGKLMPMDRDPKIND